MLNTLVSLRLVSVCANSYPHAELIEKFLVRCYNKGLIPSMTEEEPERFRFSVQTANPEIADELLNIPGVLDKGSALIHSELLPSASSSPSGWCIFTPDPVNFSHNTIQGIPCHGDILKSVQEGVPGVLIHSDFRHRISEFVSTGFTTTQPLRLYRYNNVGADERFEYPAGRTVVFRLRYNRTVQAYRPSSDKILTWDLYDLGVALEQQDGSLSSFTYYSEVPELPRPSYLKILENIKADPSKKVDAFKANGLCLDRLLEELAGLDNPEVNELLTKNLNVGLLRNWLR